MRVPVPLDLAATLHGGQAFRWRRQDDGSWRGPIGERVVTFRETARGVEAEGATPGVIASYLRIEPGDAARRAALARDAVLAPALAAHPGLRLLRQDPWETTVAFVTSANNNVLRIELILERLCQKFGEPLRGEDPSRPSRRESPEDTGGPSRATRATRTTREQRAQRPPAACYRFPGAAVISRARESTLRACGLGYRAPFLKQTARAALDMDLLALRGAPLAEIRGALLPLPGVGPKVADCIALFSLDADDAFPIDRWVLRAMHDAFGTGDKPRDVEAFARARWGDAAGLAQQYLFHAVRLRERAPGTRRLLSKRPSD